MVAGAKLARAALSRTTPLKRLLDRAADFEQPRNDAELWATSPYSQPSPNEVRTDPRDTSVFVFPAAEHCRGDGGFLLQPGAKDVLRYCAEVLGRTPDEAGGWTKAVAWGAAATAVARDTHRGAAESVRAAAGRGAGEISALVFAGALQLEDALRLAELIDTAATATRKERGGGSRRVLLAPDHQLGHLLKAADSLRVAAHLYPHCKVLSGDTHALEILDKTGRNHGVLHCENTGDIVLPEGNDKLSRAVREAVQYCATERPSLVVVSAATGEPYRSAEDVRRRLTRAILSVQRWEQTLHSMFSRPADEHFPRTFCIGRGTRSELRRVNAKAWDSSTLYDT